ncbi:MAG: T9SS type A sorting domain-containing protein [bacterium]
MKKISITFLFLITYIANSQEIIKDTLIINNNNYLRNTGLLFYNNHFYLSGFSSTKNVEGWPNETNIHLTKLNQDFNFIWETKTSMYKDANALFSIYSYINQEENINHIAKYSALVQWLYVETVDTSGKYVFKMDSVNMKKNFMKQAGEVFVDYDYTIKHIYVYGREYERTLVLQTYSSEEFSISSEDTIYKMDTSKYSIKYNEIDINTVLPTKDSGFVIAGELYDKTKKKYDMFFIKYDKNINIIWERIYDESDSINPRHIPLNIIENSEGDLLIIGRLRYYINPQYRTTVFIKKFDSKGNFIWEQKYFENLEIVGLKLLETNKGNYYIAASSFQKNVEAPPDTYFNFCLFKVNNRGELIWENIWGIEDSQNLLNGLYIENDNEVVVSGSQDSYTYIARIIDTTKVNIRDKQKIVNYFITFPNPLFKGRSFIINFSIEQNSKINIEIINNLGIKISDIFNGSKEAGEHSIQFEPDNSLPTGTYWVRMIINRTEQIVKPIVIIP